MALLQSALGNHNSGSFTAGAGGTTAATVQLGSDTLGGTLIVLIVSINQHRVSGSGFAPAFVTPTTSGGVTWSPVILAVGPGDLGTERDAIQIFACGNSPIIAASNPTTVTYAASASSAGGTLAVESAIYEFSGLSTSFSSYNTGAGLINAKVTSPSNVGGTPDPGNITTTTRPCLIVSYFKGNFSNLTAGSGYTLGETMSTVTFGQAQYQLNVSPGTTTTAFAGGTETNWGAAAVAFQGPASTGNSSYGFFFG